MESKYSELTNKMRNLCNELDNCVESATFEDDEEIDEMRYIIDSLTVAHDALEKYYQKENYKLKDLPKQIDGSYKKIYVYKTEDCFDGYWTEGTPETIREIDLEQDRDWSYSPPSEWD